MALPKDVKARSREEWTKLAATTDPKERRELMTALRGLGHEAVDIMAWDVSKRVDTIMAAQDEEAPKKSAAKAEPTKAEPQKAAAGSGGVDAATKAAIAAQGEKLEELEARTRKIHDLLVILCVSNAEAKSNAEDNEVELKLLGNA